MYEYRTSLVKIITYRNNLKFFVCYNGIFTHFLNVMEYTIHEGNLVPTLIFIVKMHVDTLVRGKLLTRTQRSFLFPLTENLLEKLISR